jgi:uncharacterized protein (TIGR02118 family)
MIKIIDVGGRPRTDLTANPPAGLSRLIVSRPILEGIANRPFKPLPAEVKSAWFDDAAAAAAAYGVTELAELRSADRPIFVANEVAVVNKSWPVQAVKLLAFVKRKPGLTVDAFQSYWRDRHGPIVTRTPLLLRYVQSHLTPHNYRDGDPICDGTAELWWKDLAAYRESWASPSIQVEQFEDAPFFLGSGPFIGVVREELIYTRR